jgi:hypothetical protein
MPISGTPILSPDSVYLGSTLPIVFLSPDSSIPLTITSPMCDNNIVEELGGGDQGEGRHYGQLCLFKCKKTTFACVSFS